MAAQVVSLCSQIQTICAQLQALVEPPEPLDPIVEAVSELCKGWTREDAKKALHGVLDYCADDTRYILPILKHLHVHCGLTADDMRERSNAALHVSAQYGRLDVLRYLREGFGLTLEDARADNNFALRQAVVYQHLETVK